MSLCDGSYPKNTWQWIDADGDHIAYCYYFDAEGYCLLNQKTPDGYMVSPSGEWIFDEVYLPATKIVNTLTALLQKKTPKVFSDI